MVNVKKDLTGMVFGGANRYGENRRLYSKTIESHRQIRMEP